MKDNNKQLKIAIDNYGQGIIKITLLWLKKHITTKERNNLYKSMGYYLIDEIKNLK